MPGMLVAWARPNLENQEGQDVGFASRLDGAVRQESRVTSGTEL